MKIVCIGNSIVNGFPHKRSQCFVSLWRESSKYEIINKGENGDTTPNILARFEKDVISHKPAKVIIMTGTNDFIYQISTPSETLGHMDRMVEMSKEKSIEPVLLTPLLIDISMASIHWIPNVDYALVEENLKILGGLILDYGKKNSVKVIDTQKGFFKLYTEENKTDYLIDGIHPTIIGHIAMAKFLQD